LKQGANEAAIQDFTNVIKQDPDFDPAYYGRGTAFHCIGEYDLAIRDVLKAIELDPNDSDYPTMLEIMRRGKEKLAEIMSQQREREEYCERVSPELWRQVQETMKILRGSN